MQKTATRFKQTEDYIPRRWYMFVISASELSQENREQKTRLGVAVYL